MLSTNNKLPKICQYLIVLNINNRVKVPLTEYLKNWIYESLLAHQWTIMLIYLLCCKTNYEIQLKSYMTVKELKYEFLMRFFNL